MVAGHPTLELMDWKRRVAVLFAEVRAARGDPDAVERFREHKDTMFREHPSSPIPDAGRAAFAGVPYYPYLAEARVEAPLEPEDDGPSFTIPSSTDEPIAFRRLGFVGFEFEGEQIRLAVYWLTGYGGGIFLPFRDATAGEETYGGGRYLLDTVKGGDLGMSEDGERLVLDFNYAYNPSCSYDPRWSCPLAPLENRLDVPIRAGERMDD
ncbi:MAG: DUF1684 domain-containing protein [Miltoncostaeaceae bacterium]